MDSQVFEAIINEYEKQRSVNKSERDKRIAKVYEAVPEIKDIDLSIAQIGSSTLREILANPDKTGAKEEMKKKFEALRVRKRDILKKNNIPEDYDRMRYSCEMCGDTGYIEGKGRCSCFKQKLINHLYDQSNMRELMEKQNFESFNMNYYSRTKKSGSIKTPYDNMLDIKNYCIRFIENFDRPSRSIVFYGDTGLGKTFMSSCIAKSLIEKGRTVIYLRASKLFRMFDDERFGRLTDGMDDIYNADLLIIDDLGTEASGRNNNSYILELINERISRNKKIIINTNLNFEGIEKMYTKRVSSRILEDFDMIYFYGDDIRRVKLFNKKA